MNAWAKKSFWLLLLVSGSSVFPRDASATLGEDAASVRADALLLQGSVQTATTPRYQVHEISTANGLRVEEYLDFAGRVFAVSWKGPAMPDLQLLLGAKYAQFRESFAASAGHGVHRATRFSTRGLVVEFQGHLRAYSGRAYIPDVLPTGLTPAELR